MALGQDKCRKKILEKFGAVVVVVVVVAVRVGSGSVMVDEERWLSCPHVRVFKGPFTYTAV